MTSYSRLMYRIIREVYSVGYSPNSVLYSTDVYSKCVSVSEVNLLARLVYTRHVPRCGYIMSSSGIEKTNKKLFCMSFPSHRIV